MMSMMIMEEFDSGPATLWMRVSGTMSCWGVSLERDVNIADLVDPLFYG